jgi:nucleotide-binding universal stress UspA family protein
MQAVEVREPLPPPQWGSDPDWGVDDLWPSRTLDHVLVPLDGSAFAQAAMSTAEALAERFGAELHAIDVDPADHAAELAGRALELGSSLVCMSTRPRGRISGAFLDWTAGAVLRGSGRPIVALGPSAERPGWVPARRGWPPPLSAGRIVVCVDGSEESERALPEAAAWATALHSSLTILTVIDDAPEPVRARPSAPHHRGRLGAAQYLDSLVDRWDGPTLHVDRLVLRDPIGPASALRNHLRRSPAALVALVAPDRSGSDRIRRGATAEKIVRASPAPCLLIPASTGSTAGLPDAGHRDLRLVHSSRDELG